jgi:hypothetical protein
MLEIDWPLRYACFSKLILETVVFVLVSRGFSAFSSTLLIARHSVNGESAIEVFTKIGVGISF